jgi:hypothetical protein
MHVFYHWDDVDLPCSVENGAKRKPGKNLAARIEKECNDISPLAMLKPAKRDYLSGICTMQR